MKRNMENKLFDPIAYFSELAEKNRLCHEHGFKVLPCSGPESIEGIINEFRKTENFVLVDDTTDNNVHSNKAGFFTKSIYTVWILAGCKMGDADSRKKSLELCRTIFKQFLAKTLADKFSNVFREAMYYLGVERIYYKELGRYSFNGATGLYFMIDNDLPTDLVYKAEDWEE